MTSLCTVMLRFCLFATVLLLVLWCNQLCAATCSVYGPDAEVRTKDEQPHVLVANLDVIAPETSCTLKVISDGIRGSDITRVRSSSAGQTLDGEIIVLPDDPGRKKNKYIESGVTLQTSNQIPPVPGSKSRRVAALEIDGIGNDPAVFHITGAAISEVARDPVSRPGSIDNAEGQVTDILYGSYAGVSGEVSIATLHGQAVGLCPDIG